MSRKARCVVWPRSIQRITTPGPSEQMVPKGWYHILALRATQETREAVILSNTRMNTSWQLSILTFW